MKADLNHAADGQFESHADQEALFMELSTQATARICAAINHKNRGEG